MVDQISHQPNTKLLALDGSSVEFSAEAARAKSQNRFNCEQLKTSSIARLGKNNILNDSTKSTLQIYRCRNRIQENSINEGFQSILRPRDPFSGPMRFKGSTKQPISSELLTSDRRSASRLLAWMTCRSFKQFWTA